MTNQPPIDPGFPTGDFLKGHLDAFGKMYRLYYPGIIRFAKELIQDNAIVEKIVTDTFFKLWISHTGFDNPKNIEAFLHIGVQRACLGYLGQVEQLSPSQLRRIQEAANQAVAHYPGKDVEAIKTIILAWFQQLPAPSGEIARLAYADGLTDEQVGERVNSDARTVKEQKAKAILLLKEQWLARSKKELIAFRDLLELVKR